MRTRILVIVSSLALIVVAIIAHMATWKIAERNDYAGRVLQHESALHLDDLPSFAA